MVSGCKFGSDYFSVRNSAGAGICNAGSYRADTYEKQEVEYIEIGEIDTDSLEDEKMFQSMDSYFITEGNKIITEVSGDSIQRRACRHKYEAQHKRSIRNFRQADAG